MCSTGLLQVLELCFKLYSSREPSVHSTAGVAIRQIVTALFDRLSVSKEAMSEEETEGKKGDPAEHHLSREVGDAYLLFQVLKKDRYFNCCSFYVSLTPRLSPYKYT